MNYSSQEVYYILDLVRLIWTVHDDNQKFIFQNIWHQIFIVLSKILLNMR
jgi:hypothetical protein